VGREMGNTKKAKLVSINGIESELDRVQTIPLMIKKRNEMVVRIPAVGRRVSSSDEAVVGSAFQSSVALILSGFTVV
jgi:hypothetical protein